MATRQSELLRILSLLSEELPDPYWVALVDQNGLVVASVPAEPLVDPDSFSAMTAAATSMGERVLEEIEGGGLRFISVIGSKRQLLTVSLSKERLLSIGLGPEIPAQATFGPLRNLVPDLLRVLQMRFTAE